MSPRRSDVSGAPDAHAHSPVCPAPSPRASPAPSPRLVHRPGTLITMEQAPRKGLEKSQSFCASLAPIMDECVVTSLRPEHAMCPPVVRRPEIVLTSPLESSGTSEVTENGHLLASMDILSRKLIQESLATVAVIQQYSDKIPSPETASSAQMSFSSTRIRSSR